MAGIEIIVLSIVVVFLPERKDNVSSVSTSHIFIVLILVFIDGYCG